MLIDFIPTSDRRWRAALEAVPHDVYHLPEYLRVCGRQEAADPFAFYAEEGNRRCLVPLLTRRLPGRLSAPEAWSDAVSPYGYCSPLVTGGEEFARSALAALAGACRERRIVSVFVRLHPLLAVEERALDAAGVRVFHGETVYLDLSLPQPDLDAQLRKDHRAGIRRLRSLGFAVTRDDWSLYGRFSEMYLATMERLRADAYYRFSTAYFEDLRDSLGERIHLFTVLAPDGSVAAAGLFTETDGVVEYHLSGTAQRFRAQAPSKLLLEEVKRWARNRGDRALHLGGGLGARNDSLFEFKAGFSRMRARFETWRVVCDPDKYEWLRAAARLAPASPSRFFPEYRNVA